MVLCSWKVAESNLTDALLNLPGRLPRASCYLTKTFRACNFGPLKGVSKSVQLLFNGIEAGYGTDFDNF